jgi:hypothetical protein
MTEAIPTVSAPRDQHLRDLANCIRFLSMDAVQKAKSGHPGMPMGMADIAAVLFSEFMRFDAGEPIGTIGTVCDLERSRIDAALQPALSDRLRGHDDR